MKANASFQATAFRVARKWLAGAMLLAVLAAGGLVAAAATASAQSGALNPDDCAVGGTWITDAHSTGLAQDCHALVTAHNTWIAAGTDDANSVLGTWGTGAINTWAGITLGDRRVDEARNEQTRVVGIANPHFGVPAGFNPQISLRGGLPAALCELPALEILDIFVGGNMWDGATLPDCYATELPNLLRIHLRDTGIGGTLSEGWCNKPRLGVLRLEGNHLDGVIPSCLGRSNGNQALTVVQLNRNELSGAIPVSLARSTQLQVAWLSENQLSGALPAGWPNARSVAVGSNDLSGPLPSTLAVNGHLVQFNAEANRFTGPIPAAWTDPGRSRIDRVVEFDVSDNDLSGVIDVDWLDAISFVNVNYPLSVELDRNNFCFSSPRAIDATALVNLADTEMPNIPLQPTYLNDRRIPWLQPPPFFSPNLLGIFNLRDQNCGNPALAESNLSPRQLAPTSVIPDDSTLTVSWDAAADPHTGTDYDVTFYEVRITPPGDSSAHLNPGPETQFLLQLLDTALGGAFNVISVLERNGVHSQITTIGSDATSLALTSLGRENLPSGQYEVSVWPWRLGGTLSLEGFNTVFIPSDADAAARMWHSTNVVTAGVTEGQVLQGLASRSVYAWDGTAQNWDRLNDRDSTTQLPRGTGLLFRQSGAPDLADSAAAGTGRLDQDDTFTLYPGWNLVSPPADVLNRLLSSRDNPALFWNERLWGCSNDQELNHGGVAALLAYHAASNRWKAHVTCSPDLDVAMQGFIPLNQLDDSDVLFVYFNSASPTAEGRVAWRAASGEYQAG